tara:strand:+ start:117 stop:458 length:342 start_codon:yes stop_codon:yes gene_type:complete
MMNADPAADATAPATAPAAAPVAAPAAANATAAAKESGPSAATPASKYPAPEKVQTLDPKIAKAHTTFYNGKKDVSETHAINDVHMDGYVYENTVDASESIPHARSSNPPLLV